MKISCLGIQRNTVEFEIRFDTGESNVTKPMEISDNEQDKAILKLTIGFLSYPKSPCDTQFGQILILTSDHRDD